MGKETKAESKKVTNLPLFEYARHYENFNAFDDGNHYFVHCLQTSGFEMKEIAQWMGLSTTGLSHRMDLVDPDKQFTLRQRHAYIVNSGDPRPGKYDDWLAGQAQKTKSQTLQDKLIRILPHVSDLRQLCDLLEGK